MERYSAIHGIYEFQSSEDVDENESQPDPIHIGEQEAWLILEQETTPFQNPNGSQELRHQVIGGALVEELAYRAKAGEFQDRLLQREWMAFKWGRQVRSVKEMLNRVFEDVFPHGKELGHTIIGTLIIMDAELIADVELEELAGDLMDLKVQVDLYNRRERTNHYVMVALALYAKEEKGEYTDAKIASANAVISAFNSFARRPTFDLNRFLLDPEVGRPINIRYETNWKINPESFKQDGAVGFEVMLAMVEKLMEFLNEDDGLRCKEDDLTFPFKKDKSGVARFLPEYKVYGDIPHNNFDVVIEGQSAEALYWVRIRLIENGADEDEVPPLPELDIERYTFKPWKKGQSADTFPAEKEDRDRLREEKRLKKVEKKRQKSEERQKRWVDQLHSFLVVETPRRIQEKKVEMKE